MTASSTSWTATATPNGRVTIPRAVRAILGADPGTKIQFELRADGEIALRVARPDLLRAKHRQSRFGRLRGIATVKMRTDEILALTRGA